MVLEVTNVSPVISNDFKRLTDASWYGSAYLLTATASQPTWGKIYQLFSAKSVYLLNICIFFIGSLVSAVAPTSIAFIIGRAVAGIGVGGVFSGGLTIIAYSVPLEKRPMYTSILVGFFGVRPFLLN